MANFYSKSMFDVSNRLYFQFLIEWCHWFLPTFSNSKDIAKKRTLAVKSFTAPIRAFPELALMSFLRRVRAFVRFTLAAPRVITCAVNTSEPKE